MTVYIFFADGFEEIEALTIVDVLRRGGIDAQMVSIMDSLQVQGAHGIEIMADCLFDDTDFSDAEMLLLPGGGVGTTNLGKHAGLAKLLTEFYQKDGKISAICAAPSVLGELNLLHDEEAICYPGMEEKLIGAHISKSPVVKSGRFITGKGPAYALEFSLAVLADLKGKQMADYVAGAMLYKK